MTSTAAAARPDTTAGRQLRRYYALRALGSQADNLLVFVVPLLVFQLSHSAVWSGFALFMEWLPRLLGFPLSGPLVDRFGVRRTYLVAEVVRVAVALVSFAVVLVGDHVAVLLSLIVLGLVAGVCSDVSFIAGEKAVRVLAPAPVVARAQSILGAIDQATLVVAPVVGGVLVALIEAKVIGCVAVLFLGSLGLVLATTELAADAGRARETSFGLREIIRGTGRRARWIWSSPIMRTVVGVTMLVNLQAGLVLAATPAVLIGQLNASVGAVSVTFMGGAAAALLGLAVTPWMVRTLGLLRVGVCSGLLCCAAIAACGVVGAAIPFMVLTIVFTAAMSVFTVFIRTVRARVVPVADFGGITGVVLLLNFLAMPVAGLLLAGATHLSVQPTVLYGGAGLIALLVCVVGMIRLTTLMPQRRGPDRQWRIPAIGDDDVQEG